MYQVNYQSSTSLDFSTTPVYLVSVRCDDVQADGATDRLLEVYVEENLAPVFTGGFYPYGGSGRQVGRQTGRWVGSWVGRLKDMQRETERRLFS